jgi:RNA-directed DNA polymerase
MAWPTGPAGVEEQGTSTWGFPRNLGIPVVSTTRAGQGATGEENPGPVASARPSGGSGLHGRTRSTASPSWYRQAKATKRGGMGGRDSEHPIVPPKRGNPLRGDPVEGRGCRIIEPLESNMTGPPRPETVSTKRQRIAALARQAPTMAFTTLAHHIDLDWLKEAYRLTRKDGAVGIDGQTAGQYAADLEVNLQSLLNRAKSGTYKAPPVRRVHIPKGKGNETRPIGIPTFEDKVLQRAVVMVLESVYEQDFLDCSYGFRPGRSPHQALESFRNQMMEMRGGWVIELDIRKFFDSLDHTHLREMLSRRIRDGVLKRLIGKWLKAGVLEDGCVHRPKAGSPQGGVISPLLANVYLHHVLDRWFEQEVRPRMKGRAVLVRFADDAVLGLECEQDARRVLEVLPKRFARYGLTLHPTKTRLVQFTRPPYGDRPKGGDRSDGPGSFDLLGFTHYWGRSLRGHWIVKQKTAHDRLSRGLRAIRQWCRIHRHQKVAVQRAALDRKLQGHYAYYGITGNYAGLLNFYRGVQRSWRKWLSRRSQKAYVSWVQFYRLLARHPLPAPMVVHSVLRRVAKR